MIAGERCFKACRGTCLLHFELAGPKSPVQGAGAAMVRTQVVMRGGPAPAPRRSGWWPAARAPFCSLSLPVGEGGV